MPLTQLDSLKGIMKTRLLRQASAFYWGLCPRPTQSEYNEMSTALCDRIPQLKDKRPVNGRYWVCEKIHKYYACIIMHSYNYNLSCSYMAFYSLVIYVAFC